LKTPLKSPKNPFTPLKLARVGADLVAIIGGFAAVRFFGHSVVLFLVAFVPAVAVAAAVNIWANKREDALNKEIQAGRYPGIFEEDS